MTRPPTSTVTLWCLTLPLVGCGGAESTTGFVESVDDSPPVALPSDEAAPTDGRTFVALKREWQPIAKPRDWKYIVLHHTATDRGSVESIHEVHRRRKDAAGNPWLGIGYHFVVGNGDGMKDGLVEPTFRWRGQLHGAHAGSREYNERGIGIVLVGNFEKRAPTPAQRRSLEALLANLSREFGIPAKNVVPHRDLKATACPGKYFPLHDVAFASIGGGKPDGDERSASNADPATEMDAARIRATVPNDAVADSRGNVDEDEAP